jgi:hypothetical protein
MRLFFCTKPQAPHQPLDAEMIIAAAANQLVAWGYESNETIAVDTRDKSSESVQSTVKETTEKKLRKAKKSPKNT